MSHRPTRICLTPKVSGVGGMVSFQHKLAAGLAERGIDVCYDMEDRPYQAVLVIGGTRRLDSLWRAHRQGVRVVQRLDGMNWLHRLDLKQGRLRTGWRHFLRAEYGNAILATIRSRLAHHIVYQSAFTQCWWERVRGPTQVPATVIHNGINLDNYTPQGAHQRPSHPQRLLLVEGSLMGGYEQGLAVAVQLAERVAQELKKGDGPGLELMVVGRVPTEQQRRWEEHLARNESQASISLVWAGLVDRERIPEIDRSAHLLYSSDVNAACPNSVIEALACGLPVISFDTGALPELVTGDSGRIVPYGGDPWQLEPPDVKALAQAALEVLKNQPHYRKGARDHAERAFSLDDMVNAYLEVLTG